MQAPIFQFNRHRSAIEHEVVERVVDTLSTFAGDSVSRSYQIALNDAAYHEIRRLERSGKHPERLAEWHRLARRIGRLDAESLRGEVKRLAAFYIKDVVGHFDRRVYRFASSVLPVGLGALFNTAELPSGLGSLRDLSQRIRVEGDLEGLRALAEKGTLVVVPTHASNLDSIVLGWSLTHAGLPPCTYGAGKNLFSNKLVGFFMRNLGAYRVDRRIQHTLYKQVLKTYSQVLLERGYHSLFFPGGTRIRSGEIEQKLKLGLMGSALAAFSERAQRGDERPIYIVPVTINYPLVLEAESLVDDHLKAAGKARYLVEDDEFSKMARIAHFAVKVMALETSMVIRYGAPLDVFGNLVNADGESQGPDGTVIDPRRYLWRDGVPVSDPARDKEYTRQLGRCVAAAFLRETVIMPTQFFGWLIFERERSMAPQLDLFALLRTTSGDRHDLVEVCREGEAVRQRLVELEKAGKVHLDEAVRSAPMDTLVDAACRTFGMYHARPAVERLKDGIVVRDPKLLFYYGNRLSHWAADLREAMQ